MEQLSMFDTLWERYKIKKPIRLIELFAGYGSQHLALKYLGVDFESHRIAEWAVKSIQTYKELHCGEDHTDYSKPLTVDEITNLLYKKGISADYNKPMTREQIARLGAERERDLQQHYSNEESSKRMQHSRSRLRNKRQRQIRIHNDILIPMSRFITCW